MLPRIKSIFEHTFISSFLDQASVVIDLGANEGGFAVPLVEEFHCQVYACEPVPEVYEVIPENFYIHKYPVCISREMARCL